MPNINDYHVDPVLTNLSVAYKNMDLIADKVLPRLNVKAKAGKYFVFDKSFTRIEDARRAGRSQTKEVDFALVPKNYGPLTERALKEFLEKDVIDSYPTPHDARVDATENVTARLELGLEKEVADMLRDVNTYPSTNRITLSGSSKFSDYTNSDPVGVIKAGRDAIRLNGLVMPNKLIMGYEAFSNLSTHPKLLSLLGTNITRILTVEHMKAIFQVDEIIVGGAVFNTAKEGQANALSYIWGDDIILAYINPAPRIKSVSLGYTLQMEGARYVDRWEMNDPKGEYVRANDYYDPHIVAAEAGYLIKDTV